ncbi:hypothetical protein HD553DRAFT_128716 [Filobasidium floriforme]|uniref:uncharacterized protein n=1 Tax=Filobasidium floriforme TaxID=5210 RepID=UPI001E8D03D2|nr:uncharacterized protein HD553DRAFT_128716 [Filobasidium floriforme]KAH8079647.1 hypothetical protein HD553DRAFT_128716 [Filobasidium floriforme]
MPRPAEASDSRNALSDFNFDLDLSSTTARTSEALQSPVLAQSPSTAKVKKAPFDLKALKGVPAPKRWSRRDILSRLKPTHRIIRPGPRQTMSRENLQHWWAQRAARRKERRARPPELGESDLTSMNFTETSMSSVTDSEGSGKEFSVGSRHESENGSQSPAESSSGRSGRRDGFYNLERPRPVDLLTVEKIQPRQPKSRGRFPKFSRSRPRPEHRRGLFGKLRRRKESGRIID